METMISKNVRTAVIAFAGWMIMVLPAHSQQAPFAGLLGSWTGSGKVTLSDGSIERLKVYKGASHGMCTTRKDEVNADLLAFIKG
jgi:hypothetical protein